MIRIILRKINSIIIKCSMEWATLKKINSFKIINTMYMWIFIVPIVVKIFEFVNGRIYNFEIFGEIIQMQLELPFSLMIFYFSALFFALGNIGILLRCPNIILLKILKMLVRN